MKGGLKNAHVSLDSAQDEMAPPDLFHAGTNLFIIQTSKTHFFHRRGGVADRLGDRRHRGAQSFSILLGPEDRNAQGLRALNQLHALRAASFGIVHRGKQALLHIDHEDRAFLDVDAAGKLGTQSVNLYFLAA